MRLNRQAGDIGNREKEKEKEKEKEGCGIIWGVLMAEIDRRD